MGQAGQAVDESAATDADGPLVERCRAGDAGAMQQLYARHHGRLYAMALRLTGSRADAEDVVQDAFLRAWRALDRFRGGARFGTWIYRIALNRCRDLHGRRRPDVELDEGDGQSEGGAIGDGGAGPAGGDGIARRRLETALAELSRGYREVLVLHDVMELRHPEIAGILDIDVGTSKSQLHKARARMRRLLAAGA